MSFHLSKTWLEETFPLSLICVDDVGLAVSETAVTIRADRADDALAIVGVATTAQFVSLGVTYPFPLTGADFLIPRLGTVTVTVTQNLAVGLYRVPLCDVFTFAGVCGWMPGGYGQGGRATVIRRTALAFLQVQALPSEWRYLVR